MASWPTYLPAPQRRGYEINPGDPTLRTQMDAGPDRVRRRFTAIPSRIGVGWCFSEAQLALFEAWHKYKIADGSAWFTVNLVNGQGSQSVEARFAKPPKKVLLGGSNWDVGAELEVRTMPVMTEAYLDVALDYDPVEIVYADPLFNTLVNTTLPAAGF